MKPTLLTTTTSSRTILKYGPESTIHTSHDVWFHELAPLNKYGVFAALEVPIQAPVSVPLVTTTYCELGSAPMLVPVA